MARDRDERDDDMDDDRPRRPKRYEDDDNSGSVSKPGGLDGLLGNTVTAVVFALIGFCCCPLLGLVLGGVGMATCKTQQGKTGSLIVLIASVISIALNLIARFAFNFDVTNFGK